MRLSIFIFDGFTALDAIGGYEVLARLPGVEVEFLSSQRGLVAADTRRLGLQAYRTFEEVQSTDILYVPGGPGARLLEGDESTLESLRRLDSTSTWTIGICNGVTLLAAAGLLQGVQVTTNWFDQERVAGYGAVFQPVRYHRDGKYVTGAGVSASIDTALYLAGLLGGETMAQALQLGIEYFPEPPLAAKSPAEVDPEIQQMVQGFLQGAALEMLDSPPAFAGA